MHQQERDRLIAVAREDLLRGDTNKARDSLESVVGKFPYCRPALELLGEIHFRYQDYRNAVIYWSQADRWDDDMHTAAQHVFHATRTALVREKPRSARYHLVAFAGSPPPDDLRKGLAALEAAYYELVRKQSKLLGLACVPLVGVCFLAALGAAALLTGGGWAWFTWVGGAALAATFVVLAIRALSYLQARKGYGATVGRLRTSADR